jgi:phosphonate transport system substrate-binding protein
MLPSHRIRLTAAFACACLLAAQADADAPVAEAPMTFGLTPAILHEQQELFANWARYLQRKTGRPIQVVTRDRYSDTINLLRQGKLDFAWVSDYPYVHLGRQVRLLAVPVYRGRPLYQSYLIVPVSDAHTRSIADLRGSVFAYADPYSNSGFLEPRYELLQLGEDPSKFFRRTFFTWSHRDVLQAVALGLADGGAIDSFVWESMNRLHPEQTSRTRIVSRSKEYGFPPIVANRSVGAADFKRMQSALLGMSADPEATGLLKRLNLDGFVEGNPRLYAKVVTMMHALGDR